MRMLHTFILLPLLTSTLCLAIVTHTDIEPEEAIELAKNTAFDSVGLLDLYFFNQKTNTTSEITCTATLIDPRTVLTAAHCVAPLWPKEKSINITEKSRFLLGNNLWLPAISRQIGEILVYPQYNSKADSIEAQNLALIYLRTPITDVVPAVLLGASEFENVTPSELPNALYQLGNSILKKNVYFVGFGFAGNPKDGSLDLIDYQKRACLSRITESSNTFFKTTFEKVAANRSDDNKVMGMFTLGDIGGPMFYQKNDRFYLAGINIFTRGSEKRLPEKRDINDFNIRRLNLTPYGTIGFSLMVTKYLRWIFENKGVRQVTDEPADQGSSWTFGPRWSTSELIDNNPKNGKFYEATIQYPGDTIISSDIEIEKLTMRHAAAKVIISVGEILPVSEEEEEDFARQLLFGKSKQHEFNDDMLLGRSFKNFLMTNIPLRQISIFRDRITKRLDAKHILAQTAAHIQNVTLEQGTLFVEGQLNVGALKIVRGQLQGRGEILNDTELINIAGVVAPGTANKVNALTIWGDFRQQSGDRIQPGGTLQIKIGAKKHGIPQSDCLRIKGKATLNGVLQVKVISNDIKPGDKIIILTATNGLTGTFSRIENDSHLAFDVEYLDDAVRLTVKSMEIIASVKQDEEKTEKPIYLMAGQEINLAGGQLNTQWLSVQGGCLSGYGRLQLYGRGNLEMINGMLSTSTTAPNVLDINGNYAQSGGTLWLSIHKRLVETKHIAKETNTPFIQPNFDKKADCIKATGIARLGGTLRLNLPDGAMWENGEEFTIITANKIIGQFDFITPLSIFLEPQIIYGEKEVKIKLVAGRYADLTEIKNPVARNVASYLDELRQSANNDLRLTFMRFDSMDKSEIEAMLLAFDQKKFHNPQPTQH